MPTKHNRIYIKEEDQIDIVVCGCDEAPYKAKIIGFAYCFSKRSHTLSFKVITSCPDKGELLQDPSDIVEKSII